MKVKLSELYDIGSSKRVFQSEWRDSGVPFYRAREIAKLSSDGFVDNELFIDEELYSEYIEKYGKPEAGDVMVTGVGTLGVCYVVKPDDKFYFKDGNILWFKQKAKDKILPEYLVKAFDSKEVKDFIDKNSSGTTVGTFTIQTAKKMEISLPSLYEQREIIDKVTKIETIIKQRKQELRLLDDLIKARFVELFGNVIVNDKGWKTMAWQDVLSIVNGKNQKAVEDENGEYLICGSGGAMGRATDYLTKENSVIVGRKGNINKPILMREKYWNVDTAFGLEPNTDFINVDYLFLFCVLFDFERLNKAVTIPSLTKADLLKIEMPVPDKEVQEQFADFVKQVDKSKVAVQKSLDETQLLFDSLMQEYFG